jgi:hypothetical protein
MPRSNTAHISHNQSKPIHQLAVNAKFVPHKVDLVGGSLMTILLWLIPQGVLAIGEEAGVAFHPLTQRVLVLA